jgi:hypothetical protein
VTHLAEPAVAGHPAHDDAARSPVMAVVAALGVSPPGRPFHTTIRTRVRRSARRPRLVVERLSAYCKCPRSPDDPGALVRGG